jgi:transcriptional regulatory protein LevR
MTSQVRQWLNEQQKTRVNTSLTTVDASKTIDQFEEYLKELEENINEPNQINFKVSFPFFLGMK